MSRIIALLLLLVPMMSVASDWDEAYIDSLYSGRILAPIEGVWRFPKGGIIAISRTSTDHYGIYLLESPMLDIKPGTCIGSAVTTPKDNCYDGELKSSKLGKANKLSNQTVTFTVSDHGTLTIKPYKTGYSLSFRRWFSSLFKITITEKNTRPSGLDGARRIYPYYPTDHLPICL